MSTNVEIEAKILVTESEFATLLAFLKVTPDDAVMQCNHYIDTPTSALRRFGFGLRVRERQGTFTLTLKSPLAEGTLEKNQTIKKDAYLRLKKDGAFPDGTVRDFLVTLGFPIAELRVITSLTTWRIDTVYHDRALSLDRNEYSGCLDFEIESEQSAISLAAETLKNLCEEVAIQYRPNNISKHARALRALG